MRAKQALLLLVIVGAIAGLYAAGFGEYLSLAGLQSLLGDARGLAAAHPWAALIGFAAIYVGATALSIPGATLLTLFAGAVFGLWTGTAVVAVSATLGATLAMLSARYALRDAVRARFGERLKTIDAGVAREGGFYLFALRLAPVFPFFVINLAMGLTAIRVRTYAWVSLVGMLPGTAVYVNAGRELGKLQNPGDILSLPLALAFTALALLPLVARRALDALRARRVYRGWTRPKRFDRNLIVIGAGAAGLVTSYIAATVRAKVTLIEKAEMGGDCLNRGCVPSKALIRAAHAAAEVDRAPAFGIPAERGMPDVGAVMAHVRASIAAIEPNDSVERYTALGVDVVQGEARIVSPWEVEVNGRRLSCWRARTRTPLPWCSHRLNATACAYCSAAKRSKRVPVCRICWRSNTTAYAPNCRSICCWWRWAALRTSTASGWKRWAFRCARTAPSRPTIICAQNFRTFSRWAT